MTRAAPPRFTLEPRTAAHAEALFAVLCEPALYEHLDEDPPLSVEALRHKLARSESRKSPDGSEHWLNWVVRDAAGQIAGYVQATVYPNREANVAYIIGSSHAGRGIGSAAVEQMMAIVAAEFGAHTFLIRSERENLRSVRLALHLGFIEASAEQQASKGIMVSEVLMQRAAR
jgi:RimJ/RimL family protein N-acetyltransferase